MAPTDTCRYRLWNAAEEYQLSKLHVNQGMSFEDIAPIMQRTATTLATRYAAIQ
ncbi:hypothetical protein PtrSN002B_009243 [Pyrenophora tritici-repentis]|uniref:Uncharacterized protein n=2 Tax=Pyrenophora tritici-repentis TaxID=45151 RepID=A0A2W1DAT8_9PLEO|nr:uncharacterized protein PTRG_03352 [Pyrenophora tritici-repentis Pt-1C-BFP]KAA8622549.1 hypothetical protein PtrV1_03855 [Pyrenophora tritici-repentis]EDU45875.1 predicted protein [Pyrenophora tritici-repentis Pt-1C-BFP]KAF7451536.1 hypothetical protein A1F99_033130 [Pyrenophora tritici-repentis]KAF7575354.1 hypothetical protein PtrM4_069780 [Pyrenophora tritici-repentis]KAG9385896.1 hypothetical protein A1F94_002646 [Pyrenophora tritici-repentis]